MWTSIKIIADRQNAGRASLFLIDPIARTRFLFAEAEIPGPPTRDVLTRTPNWRMMLDLLACANRTIGRGEEVMVATSTGEHWTYSPFQDRDPTPPASHA
jgi:hypothetical protein